MALPTTPGQTVQSNQPAGTYSTTRANPEAFGAGIGRGLSSLGQSLGVQADTMAELALKEGQIKTRNDMFQAGIQLDNQVREKLYDPQSGIMQRKGGNAIGSAKEMDEFLEKKRGEMLAGIQHPELRAKMDELWARSAAPVKDQLMRHEFGELQTYKADTQKGQLLSAMQDAYNNYDDPAAIEAAIAKTREVIGINTVGLPEEMTKVAEQESISGIHTAALKRMVMADPLKAQEYYEKKKGQIFGEDHVTIRQMLDPAITETRARGYVQGAFSTSQAAVELFGQSNADQAAALTPSLIQVESGGRADAESPVGASGVTQVMPNTAREIARELGHDYVSRLDDDEVKELLKTKPKLAIEYGQHYLSKQLKRFGGDAEAALIAYNAGAGVAEKWLQSGRNDAVLPDETKSYYRKVITGYQQGKGGRVTSVGQGRMTPDNWTLRNFRPEDLTAPTGPGAWVDAGTAVALDNFVGQFTEATGLRVKINEARDPNGNTAGRRRGTSDPNDNPHVENSQHLKGRAFDVQVQGWDDNQKKQFLAMARAAGFGGVGFYGDDGHLHIDTGPTRSWGPVPDWAKDSMNTPVGALPAGAAGSADPSPFDPVRGPGGSSSSSQSGPRPTLIDTTQPARSTIIDRLNQIVDPGERTRALQLAEIQFAKQDAQQKAEGDAAKQSAFDAVTQGMSPNDLPAELIRRLDASTMNTLFAYEKNRAAGDVPHDAKAWYQFRSMNEDDILQADIYGEYRNRFDDSHFDKAVEIQADIRKAREGDAASLAKVAGERSTSQILDATAKAMSLKEEGLATLGARFDQRLAVAQQAQGRELTAVEKQDIIDKLLIERTGGWNTYLMDIPREELGDYPLVESWEDVQHDDKQTLVRRYNEVFRSTPDEETALDIYNRALRQSLGAPQETWYGPEEEQNRVRSLLARAKGVASPDLLDPTEVDSFYGKWLDAFLLGD